jgi:hypothetical protein
MRHPGVPARDELLLHGGQHAGAHARAAAAAAGLYRIEHGRIVATSHATKTVTLALDPN